MQRRTALIALGIVGVLTLSLAGCNLKFWESATETPAPTEIETDSVPIADIPQPSAGTPILWSDGSYLVFVPPGDLIMGQDEIDPSDHSPAHGLTLDGFWIHQTEVTNRMYAQCVALEICTPPAAEPGTPFWYPMGDRGSDPVVGVDHAQAATYCEWIKGRLPSEAEWEKAARGTEGDPYPWGEDEPTCDLLNYEDCFTPAEPQRVRTYPLGASSFDLADTAGNVREWTLDWYQEDYYATSPASNPTGPTSGEERVVRGSSYRTPGEELAIYLRGSLEPDQHQADLGFRCIVEEEVVKDPPPPACEVQSMYIPPLDTPPTAVPFELEVTYNAYCNISTDGSEYGVVNLIFPYPVVEFMYHITGSYGSPIVKDDSSFPNMLFITNAPIGSTFSLTICPALGLPPMPPERPECPPGYRWDPITELCHFGHDAGVPYMCAGGAVDIPGFGCLPRVECGLCPVGYFIGEYEGMPVCVPVGIPDLYTLTDCLEGMLLDPESACCDLPPDTYEPTCPLGFVFDPALKMCVWGYDDHCTTLSMYIEPCPPVVTGCIDPGQYTNPTDCEAANCRWVLGPVTHPGPSYCTYP